MSRYEELTDAEIEFLGDMADTHESAYDECATLAETEENAEDREYWSRMEYFTGPTPVNASRDRMVSRLITNRQDMRDRSTRT